ncbi:MAG: sugar transferase [Candidatus Improbicoccus pseudotrichonymphae]|uniref:Sugar transferase n=1 Tax=Candidatus Improbicoccus pseudotrichonymphae TaxID=3033792 RepID=A0AA48I8Z2_9FIRM|nr:MAG: sugar transferase [Candidatus Improbicoccus pseudotrichonymphae]
MFNFILPDWQYLPDFLKNEYVKPYYKLLLKRKKFLILKRIFDFLLSLVLILILSPFFILIPILIKFDSKGCIFFRQKRVTKFGKTFSIIKFRTMYIDSHSEVKITLNDDKRITKMGKFLRKFRIDEFPQLFNIFYGDMTFVGTRPEIQKFVNEYSKEMLATLLLPAGLTSRASVEFRNESDKIPDSENYFETYLKDILPNKMKYNLEYIKNIGFFQDLKVLIFTFIGIFS